MWVKQLNVTLRSTYGITELGIVVPCIGFHMPLFLYVQRTHGHYWETS